MKIMIIVIINGEIMIEHNFVKLQYYLQIIKYE